MLGLMIVCCCCSAAIWTFLRCPRSIDSGDRFRFCRMLGTGMAITGGSGSCGIWGTMAIRGLIWEAGIRGKKLVRGLICGLKGVVAVVVVVVVVVAAVMGAMVPHVMGFSEYAWQRSLWLTVYQDW